MTLYSRNTGFAILAITASLLGGCATSTDQLISQLSTNEEREIESVQSVYQLENWNQDQLFSGTSCDSFSTTMVSSIVSRYTAPTSYANDAMESGTEMMLMYTLSSALVNRSMLCLSEALELKETTELLLKEREILLSGSSLSRKEVEAHRLLSTEAGEAILQATSEVEELQPEQRKNLTVGIITFLAGGYTTGRLVDSGADFAEDTMALAKADQSSLDGLWNSVTNVIGGSQALYTVGTGMPERVSNLFETGSYFIDYAQSQDLDLPEDATSEFMQVGAWL